MTASDKKEIMILLKDCLKVISKLLKCQRMEEQNDINHKERLKQSGFITKEEHRGKGGVEIWLNPVILGMAKLSTNCGENRGCSLSFL
ncbi:hypothetical protein [uncultured Cyclobacterium sp.]|uniref:hypothetical protein n=1 Tax=uncultured Cyclobacterium sp. TaxID=453820 RepID=UPI0030EC42FF|tara:strand:+ start:1716 stop:1979 length:264 start_codon:yes stop_codon:yes gene_type:complete